LKIAVEQQDWNIICGLYTNITGEPLSVTESEVVEEEVEEEDILSKDFDMEEIVGDTQKEEKTVDNHRESMYNDFTAPPRKAREGEDNTGRLMRAEPVGAGPLKNVIGVSEEAFVDDMSESLVDPETGEALVGNNKNVKITPRNRRKELGMNDTSIVEVVCSLCGKNQKVSSSLAHGHSKIESQNNWKCNTCSTRRGRRGRE
jgi:hypothetical protein